MKNVIKIDLAELSEDSLTDLLSEISRELSLRVQARIAIGDYPALNEEERYFVYNEKKVEAIKGYRTRTGYGLRESKAVIDNFEEYMREYC